MINNSLLTVLVFITTACCGLNETDGVLFFYSTNPFKNNFNSVDSLNYNDTAQLTKKFGSPIKTEIFTLEKPLNEFRIEIYNHIKAEDRHSKAVQIKELTWSFNKEKNLTVWYKLNKKKWAYLHHNLWYIDASF